MNRERDEQRLRLHKRYTSEQHSEWRTTLGVDNIDSGSRQTSEQHECSEHRVRRADSRGSNGEGGSDGLLIVRVMITR